MTNTADREYYLGCLATHLENASFCVRRLSEIENAERSGVAQPCPPSPTCSAPERSGGVEQVGDYLTRSAPVERSRAVAVTQDLVNEIIRRAENSCYGLDAAKCSTSLDQYSQHDLETLALILVNGWEAKYDLVSVFYAALSIIDEARDSGQRSAPKAESVESDAGASGAQARNADLSHAADKT